MPQRTPASTFRPGACLATLSLLVAGGAAVPGRAADAAARPPTATTTAPVTATAPAAPAVPAVVVTTTTTTATPSAAPIDLPFEQLPDYWLALPVTVSLSATPLPCQAGSLTTRYTIGPGGAIADPTVVAATLDAAHQAEAMTWITQSHFAPAPANAGRRAVRVSQQTKVSCG